MNRCAGGSPAALRREGRESARRRRRRLVMTVERGIVSGTLSRAGCKPVADG
jgi:hypothetical protein